MGKMEVEKCNEPSSKGFLRKMWKFVNDCEGSLSPVNRMLNDMSHQVCEVLSYFGESDSSIATVETLCKEILQFSHLYVAEQTRQEEEGKRSEASAKRALARRNLDPDIE